MTSDIQALIAALGDPDFRVRQAAATAIAKQSTSLSGEAEQAAIAGLSAMLTRKHEAARRSAADALMRFEDQAAVEATVAALTDPRLSIRLSIARAIAAYASGDRGSKGWFRFASTRDEVILRQSTKTIVSALISCSQDPDQRVRDAVITALEAIRSVIASLRKRRRGETEVLDDDDWGGPGPGPELVAPLPEEEAAAVAIAAAPQPELVESRFADLTLSNDAGTEQISYAEPLRVQQWYQLTVAVRGKPQGLAIRGKRRPIRQPRQRDRVTLTVTAEGDGFEIEEPVDTIVLPQRGDSIKQASFRIRPVRPSSTKDDRAEIRVRIYYRLNLMEQMVLRAAVAPKFEIRLGSRTRYQNPIRLTQERLEREYADFDDIQPRVMHIDITRQDSTFLFTFAFLNEIDQKVEFTAPVRLQSTDLEDDLANIRALWYDIALSKTYTSQLEGDADEFIDSIRRLAQAGNRLWTKLFKRETNSAVYKVGMWLEQNPLKPGSIVQISLGKDAADFVFPWGLIYDRPLPRKQYELPDLEGFWGIRYCIEQHLPNMIKRPDQIEQVDNPLKLEYMQWEQFRNIDQQNALMDILRAQSKGQVEISKPPITDAETCYGVLSDCDAHILYFYTHGYTKHRKADIGVGPNLDLFVRYYEQLSADSPLRATYKILYDSIKQGQFDLNRSWFELTYGKLYLDELYSYISQFLSNPLVILNMCESAQVTPSLSESFIHFFIDRGARGVLGTECPMTIEFAHPFAEKYLQDLLMGKTAGTALLDARRHFMHLKNPLGLAYTLFGSATMCFQPPRITAPAPDAAG